MAHKRGTLFLTSPLFQLVQVEAGNRDHEAHNRALLEVLNAIWARVSQKVNYHHIKAMYPKTDISLRYKNHIWDIAYLDRDGNRVLVEIKVVKKRKTKKC